MMRLSRPLPARRRESAIALINVAFLMLIFFLVAGTLTPPLDPQVELISTTAAEHAEPPDALFITREGQLRAGGKVTDAQSHVAALRAKHKGTGALEVKLAADRALPASRLIEIVAALRKAGADKISIVIERAKE